MVEVLSTASQRLVLNEMNSTDAVGSHKRPADDSADKTEAVSKKKPRVESESDSSDEEEGHASKMAFLTRIKMRNEMYDLAEHVETIQRRVECGQHDDKIMEKVVTDYCTLAITRPENKKVVNGRDLAVDGAVGDRVSRLLVTDVGKLSAGTNQFNLHHFIECLNSEEAQRASIRDIFCLPPRIRSLVTMDRSKMPAPKKVRAKVPKGRHDVAKVVEIKGKQTNEVDESNDASLMERILAVRNAFKKILNETGEKSIGYYTFVVNPDSFAETVQNCFYTSFCLKDNDCFFLERPKKDNEQPILRKLKKEERKRGKEATERGTQLPTEQCVNAITFGKWKQLTKKYNITKPCIEPDKSQ